MMPVLSEFCQHGGDGTISVTANVMPEVTTEVYQLIANGDFEQAKKVDMQLAQLHNDLFIESKSYRSEMGVIPTR